jgi:hypothetical protein
MGGREYIGSPIDKCGLPEGPAAGYLSLKASENAPIDHIHTGLKILRLTALH